jgi:hypothetical protein
LQFLLHDLPMLGKLVQYISKAFGLLRHIRGWLFSGKVRFS